MREIELTQGQVALVDDEDYDVLLAFKWQAHWAPNAHCYYATRLTHVSEGLPKRKVHMHTQLTGWDLVDHIDHNGLNNQRYNLRSATPSQNMHNRKPNVVGTSKYKGVYWREERQRWVVAIGVNGVRRKGGLYLDEKDAARAYNALARELHGEFAYLNIIEGDEDAASRIN